MPGTTSTLDAEWSLLLTACSVIPREEKQDRLRVLLREAIRWKPLLNLAEHHGTQPLLYQGLRGVEEFVPAEELRSLQQAYQVNVHKTLFLSRELIRILDCLSAVGIEAMPYKGLAVAEAVYADIALRQSGDIDLLIRPHDLHRVSGAVREIGYVPNWSLSEAEQHAYLKTGYECAFDGPLGRNLLEIQWAIQPRFYAIDFDMNALFQRAVTISVAGRPMKTPSPADLLLVLSAHAAKHVLGRLIWLCDIAHLMMSPSLDWDQIASQAKDLGIARIVCVTLLAANRLLGATIPAAAQTSFPEDSAAAALAAEIEPHIKNEAVYNVESLAYFNLMMRLRENRADRLRFLHRLVATPGPGEWKAVHLPGPLFPLYHVVRLSRLAARLFRA